MKEPWEPPTPGALEAKGDVLISALKDHLEAKYGKETLDTFYRWWEESKEDT